MSARGQIMISQTPMIQFGAGVLKLFSRQARFLNSRKALLVSDSGVRDLGILGRVVERLEKAKVSFEMFLDVRGNPTDADVAAGAERYVEAGCDSIVAVGGGSPMDVGKAIRVLARCGGSIQDYDVFAGGVGKIPFDLPPMIAIPTTAGTGSEVTNVAVITLTEAKRKISIIGVALMPTMACVDPELSAGMPPGLTAATGVDALAHCIESYCVPIYHPLADQTALGGMELIGVALSRAVKDGNDTDARSDMAMAAVLGGLSFPQKGAGAAHALSHPLSAVFGVHHGVANAIMLPHVMERNCSSVPEKFLRIAKALDPEALRPEEAAEIVRGLVQKARIPQRLSEVGVDSGAFEEMAQKATLDISLAGNPVLLQPEELVALYKKAY